MYLKILSIFLRRMDTQQTKRMREHIQHWCGRELCPSSKFPVPAVPESWRQREFFIFSTVLADFLALKWPFFFCGANLMLYCPLVPSCVVFMTVKYLMKQIFSQPTNKASWGALKDSKISRNGAFLAAFPLFWMYFRKYKRALLRDNSGARCVDIFVPFIVSPSSLYATSHSHRKVGHHPYFHPITFIFG
jgi:hypothetical protein